MDRSIDRRITEVLEFTAKNENNDTLWDKVGIPPRGLALETAISKGLPYNVFLNIIELTGIDKNTLATCLSISPATLRRREKAGQFKPHESDKLYRLTNMIAVATELFEGDQNNAIAWLRSKNKGLGQKKPVEMVSTSAGCDAVRDLIGRLEYGFIV